VDVVDLEIVAVVIEAEEIEEAAEDLAVVETSQRRRNGNQLPSWDVWSRPERFRTWNKSTYTLYPSRSTKLSTGFYQS